MALPFFESRAKKQRDRMLAVDLGGRTNKAVHLQRRGQGFALCGYALLDAPISDKTLPAVLLTEHLKAVAQALGAKSKCVTLAIGVNDAVVRHTEMPRLPADDRRLVLKHSSRVYLQQELTNHVFDCHVLAVAVPEQPSNPAESPKAQSGPPKQKILVAGARKELIDEFADGTRRAGLVAECIVPGLIAPVNAFELAMPDVFANEAVALVDLGFRNSSICVVRRGELILSRVVGIGRELRASIDFFEHQHDQPVTQAFVTGGSARSEFILRMLQQEMMIDCKVLNPATFLQMKLSSQQTAEIEQVAPQFAVALG